MTGLLHTTLRSRADELDAWDVDVDSIVATGDRVVRRRRIALGSAGVAVAAAALTAVTMVGRAHDESSTVPSGFAGNTGSSRHAGQAGTVGSAPGLVHTRFFDVPPAPDGFHVVGSLPSFASITLDGTVDDLYRDTVTSLPQADITQILRVQYHAYAADSFERSQDPQLGEAIRYDGRTFYHNTTWSPDVDYVQYRRSDGTWLRLQYPKQDHFGTHAMVEYLDGVVVNPGARPQAAGGTPQG
jgi:hypothetical protein